MLKSSFISLLALAAATPALAQTGSVQSAHDSMVADQSDMIVVTGSRAGEGLPISQLGASITVLDAQALETRQTRIVSDILRDVPGVAVSRSGRGWRIYAGSLARQREQSGAWC